MTITNLHEIYNKASSSLVVSDEVHLLQFSKPVSAFFLQSLNERVLAKKPDLQIRFFGYDGHWKNLSFLKHLNNIQRLTISDWELEDISYLSNMDKLTELNVESGKNPISVGPVSKMNNLKRLSLANNNFSDLEETLSEAVGL